VVQEAFSTTATARYADLLLPATTWGEKEGTVTNSERCISRVRAAVAGPGHTRHDWQIAVQFAQRLEKTMGHGTTLFPYATPESIWQEHRESTRGRDLDITGMRYAQLEQAPQQWPQKEGAVQGTTRLYEDAVFPTADGKANFIATPYEGVAEPREARYPFSLTTGRLRDQWHGMSRTGTLGRLFGHFSEPAVQIHPQDMAQRQLKDGDLVYVTSKRGSILVPAQGSTEVALTQAFMAMHWGEEYLSGSASTGQRLAGVNALTTPAFCPDSKQPEFKHTAVKILKADLPWNLLAVAWLPSARVLAARTELQALMARFPFASCTPFSNNAPAEGATLERSGVLFRAAGHESAPDELLQQIELILDLAGTDVLRYADKKRGQRRAVKLVHGADKVTLEGFMLAGDTSAQSWIKTLLQDELPAHTYGRALLVPGATPPIAVVSRGKPVCTCFNVTDVAIDAHLLRCSGSPQERLASLQTSLQCGTSCGSCVPQLQRMVRATETA
jgi:assimilatory nitrate reductase catalytic subunit